MKILLHQKRRKQVKLKNLRQDKNPLFLKNGFNYIEFDKSNTKRDPKKWYSSYLKQSFDDYDIHLAYDFAKRNGWTNKEYAKYLEVKYEKFGSKANNTFGLVARTSEDWIAFHNGPAANQFLDGHGSPIKPHWVGAEKIASNKINNNLKWFAYDQGIKTFFTFDENNIENAWKRLLFMKRVQPVSIKEIKNESTENKKVKRNKYMVNGKLIDKLDPFLTISMLLQMEVIL